MAKASIHLLAPEILSMVFFLYLESAQSISAEARRETLARVCRRWKYVVESSPDLWSRLLVGIGFTTYPLDTTALQKQIQRAKHCPLAIVIHVRYNISSTEFLNVLEALLNLVKSRRWRELRLVAIGLTISFANLAGLFRHMVEHASMVSSLISLHMDITAPPLRPNDSSPAVEALAVTSDVRSLTLPCGIVKPSHSLCKNLTQLSLAGHGKSDKTLLSVLRECGSLETLELSIICLRGRPEAYEREDTVSLPSLKQLTFRHFGVFPDLILMRLHLPNLQALKLGAIRCTQKAGDKAIKDLAQQASWFSSLRELTLYDVQLSDAVTLRFLRQLPGLTHLYLSSTGKGIGRKVVDALVKKATRGRTWLCPRLEKLEFGPCQNLREKDVQDVVHARVRDVPGFVTLPPKHPNLAPPVRLLNLIWDKQDMVVETLGAEWTGEP